MCVPREFTGSTSWRVEIRYVVDRQGRPLFVLKDLAAAVGMSAETRGTYLASKLRQLATRELPPFLFAARAFEDRGRSLKFSNSPLLVCSPDGIQQLPLAVCAKKRGRAFDVVCLLQPLWSTHSKLTPTPLDFRPQPALPQLKIEPAVVTLSPSPPSSPSSVASSAPEEKTADCLRTSLQKSISAISLLTTVLASQSRKRSRALFDSDNIDVIAKPKFRFKKTEE